ncbi:DUF1090 domain-containing protein [Pseudomonas sp. DTU12.3]|uniref:DUF1090 domain-containing protein n=1 Tax=Pseudomonas sp. DTU12.3 TaxID=2073078 RepID=UPI0010104CC0|nr:DUF1090 domain-containing protein [Pseudomonas sp. DTU12.3]QAX83657.1 DUF1090 domain-containing protein [Pseudomonas sp. DTU12.3]
MRSALLLSICLSVSCVLIVDSSLAGGPENCAERRLEILRQIDRADAANNAYRQMGLEQALANVERYCREPAVDEEQKGAIKQAEAEVRRRQNHLKAARQYGDVKVIKKHEARLERAEARLLRLTNE